MRILALCEAIVVLLLTGCGLPASDHPLSSEADSVLDERLFGVWEPAKSAEERDLQRLYIGRLKGSKSGHEVLWVALDKNKHLDVQRYRVFATELGKTKCVSVTNEDGKDYILIRYEFDAQGRLRASALDEQKVVDAIRTKKIAGRVKEDPDYGKGLFNVRKYAEVRLTAPTKALRAWLEHAPAMWTKIDDNVPLRKLDFEGKDETK